MGTAIPRNLPVWLGKAVGMAELMKAGLTGRPPLLTPATVEIFKHDWPMRGAPTVAFGDAMSRLVNLVS